MDKQNDKTAIAKLTVAYSYFTKAFKAFSCSVLYMRNQSAVLAITRLNDIPLTVFCVKRLNRFFHQNSTKVSCNTILHKVKQSRYRPEVARRVPGS
jgi:hypothetical protein